MVRFYWMKFLLRVYEKVEEKKKKKIRFEEEMTHCLPHKKSVLKFILILWTRIHVNKLFIYLEQ